MRKKIHVIINPAAGKDEPILNTLNGVFSESGVDWDVSITTENDDTHHLAKRAVDTGATVVAAYGGDGTIGDVAGGLIGSDIPLAILPGGTGNALSNELGIPKDLAQAATLICGPHKIRSLDVGQTGERYFALRVGVGYDAVMIKNATRDQKDLLGILAYPLALLEKWSDPPTARYTLKIDEQEIEVDGITCIIANSGAIGLADLSLASGIDIADGKLDVLVIRGTDLRSLLSVAAGVVRSNTAAPGGRSVTDRTYEPLRHWQAREVTITATPAQDVHSDGELLGQTPTTAKVLPERIRVIVPNDSERLGQ